MCFFPSYVYHGFCDGGMFTSTTTNVLAVFNSSVSSLNWGTVLLLLTMVLQKVMRLKKQLNKQTNKQTNYPLSIKVKTLELYPTAPNTFKRLLTIITIWVLMLLPATGIVLPQISWHVFDCVVNHHILCFDSLHTTNLNPLCWHFKRKKTFTEFST